MPDNKSPLGPSVPSSGLIAVVGTIYYLPILGQDVSYVMLRIWLCCQMANDFLVSLIYTQTLYLIKLIFKEKFVRSAICVRLIYSFFF